MKWRMTLRWFRATTGTIWVLALDNKYRPLHGGFRGLDYIFLGVTDVPIQTVAARDRTWANATLTSVAQQLCPKAAANVAAASLRFFMNDHRNEEANQIIIGALLDIKAQLDRLEAKLNLLQPDE